ncbi:hypothetical protein NLG97_g1111 [Lecanicillium saksenae]|uniref:Uncharacterized protein n=1 Tax=Lecanicillium saksenae TaxID=468837 RepID=A0ACC1R8T0_9HYPO|nr:hypothetical protein NLG97_g1111 [Lecanicillium saksenae]
MSDAVNSRWRASSNGAMAGGANWDGTTTNLTLADHGIAKAAADMCFSDVLKATYRTTTVSTVFCVYGESAWNWAEKGCQSYENQGWTGTGKCVLRVIATIGSTLGITAATANFLFAGVETAAATHVLEWVWNQLPGGTRHRRDACGPYPNENKPLESMYQMFDNQQVRVECRHTCKNQYPADEDVIEAFSTIANVMANDQLNFARVKFGTSDGALEQMYCEIAVNSDTPDYSCMHTADRGFCEPFN